MKAQHHDVPDILQPPKQALLDAAFGRCSFQHTQLLLMILPRAQQLKGDG